MPASARRRRGRRGCSGLTASLPLGVLQRRVDRREHRDRRDAERGRLAGGVDQRRDRQPERAGHRGRPARAPSSSCTKTGQIRSPAVSTFSATSLRDQASRRLRRRRSRRVGRERRQKRGHRIDFSPKTKGRPRYKTPAPKQKAHPETKGPPRNKRPSGWPENTLARASAQRARCRRRPRENDAVRTPSFRRRPTTGTDGRLRPPDACWGQGSIVFTPSADPASLSRRLRVQSVAP